MPEMRQANKKNKEKRSRRETKIWCLQTRKTVAQKKKEMPGFNKTIDGETQNTFLSQELFCEMKNKEREGG